MLINLFFFLLLFYCLKYKNSLEIYYHLKIMRPNSKEKVKTQTKTIDPLLILPQSKIHIYTDRIQICNFSPQISSINSL
jgi:hypothetical protein